MKVNQVVSEHKKGVKAHIYNKKATTKAKGAVPLYGPDKQEAKLKPVKVAEDQTIGKVQQVNPDGTAVIQNTDGNTQTVQQTQLQPGDNNTLSMQVPKITPGQQVDASKTIEENPGVLAQVNTKANPPMVMDNGNTGGSPLGITYSGGEITPAIIAASAPDWQPRSIQANGKTYSAMYSGTKGYRVSKQAYEEITGRPSNFKSPMRAGMNGTPPIKETADDQLLVKMLTIAGLR